MKSVGEPKVECAAKTIRVYFDTENQFEGHVFVKGFYDDKTCRRDATFESNVDIEVPFQSCDVRRQRSVGDHFIIDIVLQKYKGTNRFWYDSMTFSC